MVKYCPRSSVFLCYWAICIGHIGLIGRIGLLVCQDFFTRQVLNLERVPKCKLRLDVGFTMYDLVFCPRGKMLNLIS